MMEIRRSRATRPNRSIRCGTSGRSDTEPTLPAVEPVVVPNPGMPSEVTLSTVTSYLVSVGNHVCRSCVYPLCRSPHRVDGSACLGLAPMTVEHTHAITGFAQ